MSNMKNGFSTLNRWLGKKNKDKSTPNGKLSKSSTNLSLSVSTANINETSQLEYNRITPLPAATSNAPFEQTFRITVLLPKEQLYVSRLGARVPMSKLLELVCENKLLDAEKYEFRNPVDPSQVYSCDLTIGAVGLSEIRLCHKSESYDTFNTEEVIKLHRTSIIRDSLSSSEFSSRNSKHTTKTASPYSSSNSLNSMDSTGMNYTRTPLSLPPALPTTTPPKMTAPPRKKRTAPRPPSQTAIPEKSALVITNGDAELSMDSLKDATLPRKDYFVSTPNLTSSTLLAGDIDCNGNTKVKQNHNEVTTNGNHIVDESQLYATVEKKNARNLYRGSVQNLSSDQTPKFPEPSPRKRLIQIKKKSAPAPPPRGSMYGDDSISIASTTASTPDTPLTPATPDIDEEPLTPPDIYANSTNLNASESSPKAREAPRPLAREFTPATKPMQSSTPVLSTETVESVEVEEAITAGTAETPTHMPKPVPRLTTTTLLNANTEVDVDSTKQDQPEPSQHINVSKVMLNRTPTPEPRSLSSEPPEMMDSSLAAHISELNNATSGEEDDNVSKQADSGIGEPIPSPIPDSLPSEGSAHECKSTFESSSDDDDMIKVYNFKLGKTLVKPMGEHKTLEDLTVIAGAQTDSGETTPSTLTREATPLVSETSSWNFSIPISPPANFADSNELKEKFEVDKQPDVPITPKIKERPVLNFEALTKDNVSASNKPEDMVDRGVVNKEHKMVKEFTKVEKVQKMEQSRSAPLPSPSTPMNEIVEELSTFIQEKRMDTLIKKAEDQPKIESAKPNTLSNFSITASAQHTTKPMEILTNGAQVQPQTPESSGDEEKLYRKKGNTVNNLIKQRSAVTRSESFHTTALPTQSSPAVEVSTEQGNGLNSRSSSYLSLTKLEQNGPNLNRRRSSSELSIGESPSLQSLEVIKTILNSRKNSLANSSDGESKPTEIINHIEGKRTPTEESKPTKVVELKPKNKEVAEVEAKPQPVASKEKLEAPTKVEIEPIRAKEVPKVYRYSGPPSINFSTWNDRPKVQVSIKNEGDYIFGGTNAASSHAAVTTAAVEMTVNSMPRNYRASTPSGTFKVENTPSPPPPTVAPKPGSPIKRMGIPEKEFRVPLTVKPLTDVTVETVQLQKTTPTPTPPPAAANTQTRTSVTTVTLNGNGSAQQTKDEINRRVESIVGRRPFSQNVTHTSTLPRSGVASNRFSTPAPAAGGPTLLRSTSIHQVEANKPKPAAQAEPTAAPFGQNTLRKTGFKEKMLARQEEEERKSKMNEAEVRPASYTLKSTQNSVSTKSQNVVAPQITTNTNGNVTITTSSSFKPQNSHTPITVSSTKTLQSAKLELKLQKSTSVFVNQSASKASPPQSAPVAPPPPPPMMSFSKGSSARKSPAVTPTDADPRDQLLAAIRSFKREELNRN